MTSEEIQQHVLKADDFGFEMRTGAIIRESPARDVRHGATYIDPITSKPRQFDFRFRVRGERRTLAFAVECKNIDLERPVIVCGCARTHEEAFHDIIVADGRTRLNGSWTRRFQSAALYADRGFVGKSVVRPGGARSDESDVHVKWAQALASANDLIDEAMVHPRNHMGPHFTVVLPWVVVPDGSLWQAMYRQNGELQSKPEAVERTSLFVGYGYEKGPSNQSVILSHINFSTLTGLRVFLTGLSERLIDWDHYIPPEIVNSYAVN